MKKILAFITSLSMCLSMLTAFSPAFACENDAAGVSAEESVALRSAAPKEETEKDIIDEFDDLN